MSASSPYGASDEADYFAVLLPDDIRTKIAMRQALDTVSDVTPAAMHHQKFIRQPAVSPPIAGTARDPSPESSTAGSSVTPEPPQDDHDPSDDAPFFVLSVSQSIRPCRPSDGISFGTGDMKKMPENGGVDLLLPPATLNSSTIISPQDCVFTRHGSFNFNRQFGQLYIQARHSGIQVDRERVKKGELSQLARPSGRITIGPYCFNFEYRVQDERIFLEEKQAFMSDALDTGVQFYETTSRTPSKADVRVGNHVIHGVVGNSNAVIHSASDITTCEAFAAKLLLLEKESRGRESEYDLYCEIKSSISDHPYHIFVMQAHHLLDDPSRANTTRTAYMLWKPLARWNLMRYIYAEQDHSMDTKKRLFVQALLGLSALHERGWVHCDLKPENLAVVDNEGALSAVIIDLESACQVPSEGLTTRPRGTLYWQAPEIAHEKYGPYGQAADIWSMGAIAWFLFLSGTQIPPWIPMSGPTVNIFTEGQEVSREYQMFQAVLDDCLFQHPRTLSHLIGSMLVERPSMRPTVQQVLAHPAMAYIKQEIIHELTED